MTPLNPCQRQVLACSLVPLINLMWANAPILVDIPPPLLPVTLPLTAAMAAHNETSPHPEQGEGRITEAYLWEISEAACIWRFRVTAELIMLAKVLHIPDCLITSNCYHALALEALALTCTCLCSCKDQWALATQYSHPQSTISEITYKVVSYLIQAWDHLLQFDTDQTFSPESLTQYTTLHTHGAPTRSVVGFLNCTIQPSMSKTLMYPQYKKCHGMKFQGIAVPNGMITHLAGPYCPPQNDARVLSESCLKLMHEHVIQPGSVEGDPPERHHFQLYGDPAYGVSAILMSPHARVRGLTAEEQAWNTGMGEACISVEHAFGIVLWDWPFLRSSWKHHVFGKVCGLWYCAAVLLANAHNCFVPNQIAQLYNCMPPSIHEYFHN